MIFPTAYYLYTSSLNLSALLMLSINPSTLHSRLVHSFTCPHLTHTLSTSKSIQNFSIHLKTHFLYHTKHICASSLHSSDYSTGPPCTYFLHTWFPDNRACVSPPPFYPKLAVHTLPLEPRLFYTTTSFTLVFTSYCGPPSLLKKPPNEVSELTTSIFSILPK